VIAVWYVLGNAVTVLMQSTKQRLGIRIAPDHKEKVMSDNFVPIGDVADKFSVSKHTVRQWLRQGKIPEDLYVKIGNTYRYNLQGIENAFLNTNKDSVVKEAVSDFEFNPETLDEDF